MSTPLLSTKLYLPPSRSTLVLRPRLVDQLNDGLHCKLILISAPAGFGKTTLLSDWIEKAHFPVAWLSLDEGDNDLSRFLTYLASALQTLDRDIDQGIMVSLQSPEPVNIEIILTNLLNDIAAVPDEAILVLDDYHVIESQPVDQALTFFIDNLPPQMHLVVASRIDPSLPLSRLRAGCQMTELRADDLRFTINETAAFLNQIMGLELSSQDVVALEERTEGWIAGLQLAALSIQGLQRKTDVTEFITRFTGSDRYIQDYLTDEVLGQQPEERVDFLLQTSILNRLCGPLCDTVTKQVDSQAVLEALENENLFTVPLDNERYWYRYHHLFAELLAHHMRRTYPDQIPELHQRASAWYEGAGYIDDAILHAQTAGDLVRMTAIIEKHWQEYIHRGELTKLKNWLDVLNPKYTRKSAPLSMAYCWFYVLTANRALLPAYVKDIRAALKVQEESEIDYPPNRVAVIPSLVETIEAIISLDSQQAAQAKAHAERALLLIPEGLDPLTCELLRGAAGYWLGQAYITLGELEPACGVLLEGLNLLKASQNYFGAANSLLLIATLYQELDRTEAAIALCEDMTAFMEDNRWGNIPPRGIVYVVYARLQIETGDYQAARENFAYGKVLVEPLNSKTISDLVDSTEEKLGRVSQTPSPLVEPLSRREIEVLQLVAAGLSNREVGERLFLSLDTVKGHNRNIYGKLEVKNRTQAINKAIDLKIISPR